MSGYFESVPWNACVLRLGLGLYSHPKVFWGNGVRTHVNSKGKILSTGKVLLRGGGSNPRRCIKQDSETNTLPKSCAGPICSDNFACCRIEVEAADQICISHGHSMLTPGQPVPTLTCNVEHPAGYDSNDCVSRVPFHVKHVQLCRTR